ncbi:MAG: papain-like cysteine protease family protein [Gammaproteobacteria bacterium]
MKSVVYDLPTVSQSDTNACWLIAATIGGCKSSNLIKFEEQLERNKKIFEKELLIEKIEKGLEPEIIEEVYKDLRFFPETKIDYKKISPDILSNMLLTKGPIIFLRFSSGGCGEVIHAEIITGILIHPNGTAHIVYNDSMTGKEAYYSWEEFHEVFNKTNLKNESLHKLWTYEPYQKNTPNITIRENLDEIYQKVGRDSMKADTSLLPLSCYKFKKDHQNTKSLEVALGEKIKPFHY